jgi:hypothetical protein
LQPFFSFVCLQKLWDAIFYQFFADSHQLSFFHWVQFLSDKGQELEEIGQNMEGMFFFQTL